MTCETITSLHALMIQNDVILQEAELDTYCYKKTDVPLYLGKASLISRLKFSQQLVHRNVSISSLDLISNEHLKFSILQIDEVSGTN